MPSHDPAKAAKDVLKAAWTANHPEWDAVLHVDDDYTPIEGKPLLLVADDGGPRVVGDSWTLRKTPRRITLRLTAFALGRTEARTVVDAAADDLMTNRPSEIARIEDVSDPLVTRDRRTGAFLASITMPVIVKPVSA